MPGAGAIEHFVAEARTSIEDVLRLQFQQSSEQIHFLLQSGAIYLNRKRAFVDTAVQEGDYLRMHLQPRRFPVQDQNWKERIIRETNDYLMVNKPPGVPVHATIDNYQENLLHQIRLHSSTEEIYLTQRLDHDTEGLLLFAKTKRFQSLFNKWLGKKRIEKKYRAWVLNDVAVGTHIHYMEPGDRAPRKVSGEEREDWKRCDLTVESCKSLLRADGRQVFELLIQLGTGRTHQIRTQLSYLGSPILGDTLYAGEPFSQLCLQSYSLGFEHDGFSHKQEIPRPARWEMQWTHGPKNYSH